MGELGKMKLKLIRYKSNGDATLGNLFIDEIYCTKTLEDEYRKTKVMHETRIPKGTYQIKLQNEGAMTKKYASNPKLAGIHKGMLWLQNVPGFTSIYIHIGNTDDDSSGCILVGTSVDEANWKLNDSTNAYIRMYVQVVNALINKDEVFIEILDEDNPKVA